MHIHSFHASVIKSNNAVLFRRVLHVKLLSTEKTKQKREKKKEERKKELRDINSFEILYATV